MLLRIGLVEPHLKRFGGIRRVVELANALTVRGHDVTFYLPENEPLECAWMECRAEVRAIPDGFHDELDVLVFNHEPQWFLVDRFERVRTRVFYALHYGALYEKPGSWECIRTPVELQIANSTWTAERVEEETGHRPIVLHGGINPLHFRPVDVPKRYPLLAVGDGRHWKGSDVVQQAAGLLGLPVEFYASKDLPQETMAAEYSAAEIFVVGSDFEGFGQPGLEALACGTPLVTTDNGGCREYAIHEETALVVPPRDPRAMADAIQRLREDPVLARRLRENGLELVREKFSWKRSAEEFERLVVTAASTDAPTAQLQPNLRGAHEDPELSIVIPCWDNTLLTMACVESIRRRTDVSYELILVDNGSAWEGLTYAAQAADVPILNHANLGFAAGMNQGLHAARGDYVAFLNNDTVLPEQWASRLIETLEKFPQTAVAAPALTKAGNQRTVLEAPDDGWEHLAPFEPPPSAVLYVMRTEQARELGGWGEEYEVASGEDVDLAFKVWTNDLDITFDRRVLVEHVGHATSDAKLVDREAIWARNRQIYLDKWRDLESDVPRLASCELERWQRNRATAAGVAGWMAQYFGARDRLRTAEDRIRDLRDRQVVPPPRPAPPRPAPPPLDDRFGGRARPVLRAIWRGMRKIVPRGVREPLFQLLKQPYYRLFPERHPARLDSDA